ncbi:16S rRNA (adenine(1518)-N(6)/adenine(1519)-N(6))-dimethyltransferase RsmA [Spiroplasma platyhelix]|uniref:Ribosomal RNA small subunit methyltransferase A n=1 Tax=Spiroplasma platyhelix PALS-1 TaxID=1276218 RepID=A0A846U511_9MOLU|nr:16S rRNA (adenine(1518)-N(6)/adenine(1519)-N(6))-dimethyltransferase RsmA [Spiroplasma platyhelix]MBE4704174.1 Ribosomal RNA small subunit methyltransferase A [Spiroplasma platyhelix PALS-1]NKE38547.1 ribosomal RNA small subunit methyltransferase A [Spiroplasma platyhelix PALS-1]UJB29432.1 dimethyladenosine transferase [Spiroplasma platyhelix PALS-1]
MKEVKAILAENNLHPIKGFGQNFLFDKNIIKKIASVTDIENKNVIEIGTGLGHLTKFLVAKAKKVVTVEIDKKLGAYLEQEFKDTKNLTIINYDFLKLSLAGLIENEFDGDKDIVVIANLPYYLTSPIILKLLENIQFFSAFVLMMQKEVAQRLNAEIGTKSYSNLSVMCQFYCQVKVMFDVKPQSFFPAPKVTSSVVLFEVRDSVTLENEKQFWFFVRSCFASKRKTLINNLTAYLPKDQAIALLASLNWPLTIRAENLTFKMFYELFLILKDKI